MPPPITPRQSAVIHPHISVALTGVFERVQDSDNVDVAYVELLFGKRINLSVNMSYGRWKDTLLRVPADFPQPPCDNQMMWCCTASPKGDVVVDGEGDYKTFLERLEEGNIMLGSRGAELLQRVTAIERELDPEQLEGYHNLKLKATCQQPKESTDTQDSIDSFGSQKH